jgi:tRNA (guanine37-N1)-methyltransferase
MTGALRHIVHFSLRQEHVPYKAIIGQVCLDKNPATRTVVHKVWELENEFQVLVMEVIAGAHFNLILTGTAP